jgi:hypothetical protein
MRETRPCDRCGETKPADGVAFEIGVLQRTTPTSQEHRLGSYSARSRFRVLARESRFLCPACQWRLLLPLLLSGGLLSSRLTGTRLFVISMAVFVTAAALGLQDYFKSTVAFLGEFLAVTGALVLLLRWLRQERQTLAELALFMKRKELARTHRVRAGELRVRALPREHHPSG